MGKAIDSFSILKGSLLKLAFKIIPPRWRKRMGVHLGVPDIRWSLLQLKRFGFLPKRVMDVGAFRGDWARLCLENFPEAIIHCIEPQDSLQAELYSFAAEQPNVHVVQTLLGRNVHDTVPFDEIGPGSSVLLGKGSEQLQPMTSIDRLIENKVCAPPELLKLDVQGYEMEVLEGFTRNFASCQVIQCELSLLPIVSGAPLIHEVLAYLYKRGFVMFDVTELIGAPSDGCVWQIDALFCRIDSALRGERAW